MLRYIFIFACLFFCRPGLAPAQQLPRHNILLLDIKLSADSLWQAQKPRFLNAFNPKGYNNQPAFFSASEIYLTVQSPDDTTQTDIFALDIYQHTRTRITNTPNTAEYSPTLMPGGKRFSAVRVEENGEQRLWSFPLDRSDNGRPEFPLVKGVGYHCWLNDTMAALFIVGQNGEPHTLYSIGLRAQKLQRIAGSIGRCLQNLPGGRLAFVQKLTEQTRYLKSWDPRTKSLETRVKMPPGCEDFALLPNGAFITGSGAKLMQYNPRRDADWRDMADFSKYGVKQITRIAVGKNGQLAIVTH